MNTKIISRRSSGGFTLIEILVAIVVLAIGVLGVAALQTKSLAQGQGSLQATQAMALAYDYADRIHANICGAYAGAYEIQWSSPPTAYSANCSTTQCSNFTDLASWDRYDWYSNVKKTFPSGAYVNVACADGSQCSTSGYPTGLCGSIVSYRPQTITIYVFWNQKNGNGTTTTGAGGGSGLTPVPTSQPWNASTKPDCISSKFDPATTLPCVVLSIQP